MDVELRPLVIPKHTKFGTIEQETDQARVYVNDAHAGYVPVSGEHAGVFHPLVGFPNELLPEVLKACSALTGTLRAPALHKEEDLNDDVA